MATDATTIIEAINSEPILCPFVVLIDSREQQPFSFEGLRCDSSRSYRPIIVRTEWCCLGHFSGDYSIKGFAGAINLERKSMNDFHSTVLGWRDNHRQRFEQELENLNAMKFAAVIIEASLSKCLSSAPEWGVKTADENRVTITTSIRSWRQRFNRVQWEFCDSRRLAEETAFDHLRRFWDRVIRTQRRKYARPFRGMTL